MSSNLHVIVRLCFQVSCGVIDQNFLYHLSIAEWSGEVRSITYSADGKSVSVVYRVTLYGTDAEVYIHLHA